MLRGEGWEGRRQERTREPGGKNGPFGGLIDLLPSRRPIVVMARNENALRSTASPSPSDTLPEQRARDARGSGGIDRARSSSRWKNFRRRGAARAAYFYAAARSARLAEMIVFT
jgi:hypothetical protein